MLRISKKLLHFGIILVFLLLFKDYRVCAYIDPGVGSFVFQMLIAGLVGASFLIKVFWKQIKRFFVKYILRNQVEEDEEEF